MSERPAWDDQFRESEAEKNERLRNKRLANRERLIALRTRLLEVVDAGANRDERETLFRDVRKLFDMVL